MSKLGVALMPPVKLGILVRTWRLPEKHHIYAADALQLATAKHVDAIQFITGDKNLYNIGLHRIYVG